MNGIAETLIMEMTSVYVPKLLGSKPRARRTDTARPRIKDVACSMAMPKAARRSLLRRGRRVRRFRGERKGRN